MKVYIDHPTKLTPEELRSCRSISFRSGGDLCWRLKSKKHEKPTRIIRVFDKDLLVGWALLFEMKYGPIPYAFQVYTRKSYRRKGVGTKMFNAAANKVGANNIRYWTDTPGATEFYHHCFAPYKAKKEVVQRNQK